MSITRRDGAVVAALVVSMVVLGGVLAVPAAAPAANTPEATATPTVPPVITYREGVVGTPATIMPVAARTRSERTLVGLIFSGLVRLGPGNTYEPDLAESWTTDAKGKTWTFTLRDDATWQDGAPVTAEDVVYTVEALKSPDVSGAMAAAWADVTATAIDAKTVQFKMATPIAGFLAAATQPLMPAHLLSDVPFADLATSDFGQTPVGTGSYALTELDDTMAVLTPTALMDGPLESPTPAPTPTLDALVTPKPTAPPVVPDPPIARVEVHFYPDDAAAADAFEKGDIDGIAGLLPDASAPLATEAGVERLRYPTTTLATVLLNLRPSHPELRDVRVRQALLGAIDRSALVAGALGGDGVAADSLVPPSSWAYDAGATPVAFDTKAAAKHLTEAGWKKKNGVWTAKGGKAPYKLELLTVPAEANPRLAAVAADVAKAWTDFGIGVDVVEAPGADLAAKLRSGEFTASVLDITTGLEPDLYPLLASSQVRGSGTNLSGYQDPALDALLEAARKPGEADVRMAAWKALLAGLAARQPVLPLAWHSESVLFRGVDGPQTRLIADPGDRFWDVLAWRLAADR